MVLNTLLGNLPPIATVILSVATVLAVATHMDQSIEIKIYLIKGRETEIWRYFTNILYFGKFSLSFLFQMILSISVFGRVEEHCFKGNSADYFFFLTFLTILLNIGGYLLSVPLLSSAFLIAHCYIWGKFEGHQMLFLFGIIPVRNSLITWVFLMIDYIQGENIRGSLVGILIAHFFYYIRDIYPELPMSKGSRPFSTPEAFKLLARMVGLGNRRLAA